MQIETVLYLANTVDKLNFFLEFFITTAAVGCLVVLFLTAIFCEDDTSNLKNVFNFIKKNLWIFVFMCVISAIIPSEKTVYMMMGANYFKNSALPPKIEAIIEKKLDKYLLDLNKKEKE